MNSGNVIATIIGEWLTMKRTRSANNPAYDEVARVAYEIYERRGCQDGRALEDWLVAERLLMHHCR